MILYSFDELFIFPDTFWTIPINIKNIFYTRKVGKIVLLENQPSAVSIHFASQMLS